mmetsp:Transcript_24361/g.70256  ORF Transcript_24361/g.70256 Transcript_24361/m.70256 type:complete len:287 (+) Transcript_24361:313-1173(+)
MWNVSTTAARQGDSHTHIRHLTQTGTKEDTTRRGMRVALVSMPRQCVSLGCKCPAQETSENPTWRRAHTSEQAHRAAGRQATDTEQRLQVSIHYTHTHTHTQGTGCDQKLLSNAPSVMCKNCRLSVCLLSVCVSVSASSWHHSSLPPSLLGSFHSYVTYRPHTHNGQSPPHRVACAYCEHTNSLAMAAIHTDQHPHTHIAVESHTRRATPPLSITMSVSVCVCVYAANDSVRRGSCGMSVASSTAVSSMASLASWLTSTVSSSSWRAAAAHTCTSDSERVDWGAFE